MRGMEALSESLSKLVDALPRGDLPRVISCALQLVARDHPSEPIIQEAVKEFFKTGIPRPELVVVLDRESERHDREYQRLEEQGELEKADYHFRVMCACNGLRELFASNELTLPLVDCVIYNLGFGAASVEFGKELEAMIRSQTNLRAI